MPKNPAGSTAAKTGLGREFSSSIAGVSSHFPVTRTAGLSWQLPSFRSVPCSAGEVAGIARAVPVKVAGRVGFAGQTGSTLFLSLSHVPLFLSVFGNQLPLSIYRNWLLFLFLFFIFFCT